VLGELLANGRRAARVRLDGRTGRLAVRRRRAEDAVQTQAPRSTGDVVVRWRSPSGTLGLVNRPPRWELAGQLYLRNSHPSIRGCSSAWPAGR